MDFQSNPLERTVGRLRGAIQTAHEYQPNGGALAICVLRLDEAETLAEEIERLQTARPLAKWHEDKGPTLWWRFPIDEPPYCGTPLDDDWPGYHTHWTPIAVPEPPNAELRGASQLAGAASRSNDELGEED